MNRIKLIFNQTLMISTAILFGLGIQACAAAVLYGDKQIVWDWYTPFTIIFTGFLCSIPSVIFLEEGETEKSHFFVKVVLHFFAILGVVSLCGKLFGWYSSLRDYLWILLMYVVIYFFVWGATYWLIKKDENKINKALEEFRDEE
ncbi:MAG: DUF3021 domain-containing protein [Lachnospiraceae bacterium]|nr:DUF3021 domain-containing protein [Lachnospiraceae bacterium]